MTDELADWRWGRCRADRGRADASIRIVACSGWEGDRHAIRRWLGDHTYSQQIQSQSCRIGRGHRHAVNAVALACTASHPVEHSLQTPLPAERRHEQVPDDQELKARGGLRMEAAPRLPESELKQPHASRSPPIIADPQPGGVLKGERLRGDAVGPVERVRRSCSSTRQCRARQRRRREHSER